MPKYTNDVATERTEQTEIDEALRVLHGETVILTFATYNDRLDGWLSGKLTETKLALNVRVHREDEDGNYVRDEDGNYVWDNVLRRIWRFSVPRTDGVLTFTSESVADVYPNGKIMLRS